MAERPQAPSLEDFEMLEEDFEMLEEDCVMLRIRFLHLEAKLTALCRHLGVEVGLEKDESGFFVVRKLDP